MLRWKKASKKRSATRAPSQFDPVLWHPAQGEAAYLFAHLCTPVFLKVTDALKAHRELLGYPEFRHADVVLPAFLLALADVVLREVPEVPGGQAAVLQSLGAMLCRAHRGLRVMVPESAWTLLSMSAMEEFAPPERLLVKDRQTFVTNRLLETYCMGGPENLDTVMAIDELISPHMEVARAGLEQSKERAMEWPSTLDGGGARPGIPTLHQSGALHSMSSH